MGGRFIKRGFASAALLVVGCGESGALEQPLPKSQWGRADTIRYFVPDYPDPFPAEGLAFTVSELTGLEFVESGSLYSAVAVLPLREAPNDGTELGEFSSGTCAPWVSFDPTNNIHFGHMLGHAAGLEHHHDGCNFMSQTFGLSTVDCDDEFFADEEQLDELRAFAWALENVCGEWD